MEHQNFLCATVDEDGRLILPPEAMADLGLVPGMEIPVETTPLGATLRRAATHLGKVYIEPTSRRNLTCETCIRNSWNENQGDMKEETFNHLLDGVQSLEQKPLIIFGGCCIAYHVHDSVEAGATRQELLETIGVALLMGGGPGSIYAAHAMDAIEQFIPEAVSAESR